MSVWNLLLIVEMEYITCSQALIGLILFKPSFDVGKFLQNEILRQIYHQKSHLVLYRYGHPCLLARILLCKKEKYLDASPFLLCHQLKSAKIPE